MANATYYGAKYFADQPIPACTFPGEVRVWQDSFTCSAVLATSDTIKFARLPDGHIPLSFELAIVGDLDTGANTLAVKIGTTADDDLLVAAAVIGVGDALYAFPTNTAAGSVFGSTTSAAANYSGNAASTSNQDLTIIPTAAATTASTGTGYGRLYYTVKASPSVYDPTNSPSVVTS